MARILPFPGVRYNQTRVGDMSRVVSPPYDVISAAEVAALQARSDYNAVHIDLPRPDGEPGDLGRYEEAGRLFREWIATGVLVPESKPALYLYRQTYVVPTTGASRQLLGFMAAVELAPWSSGVVLPHEHTFSKPKADRLNLMRATAANLSPVYGFYSDPSLTLETAWQCCLETPSGGIST